MHVDFDDKLDAPECCDGDPRRTIMDAFHPFGDHSIDGIAVAPVRQIDRYLDDVFQPRSRRTHCGYSLRCRADPGLSGH